MESLNISIKAIEQPELIYKTSREIQIAAYSSVLSFLLIAAAIQISVGSEDSMVLLLIGLSAFVEMIALIFLLRGISFFTGAEWNRKENSILFANSILETHSDEAFTNYRNYNIRVIRTHNSGYYLGYIILSLMAVSLFVVQIIMNFNGTPLTNSMQLIFGLIVDGYPVSMVSLGAMIILATGVIGIGFRIFSNVNIARYNSKSKTEILNEVEKLISKYSKDVKTTYEEGINLLKDAENGDPAAIEQRDLMEEGMNREIARFRIVKFVFILLITIVTIIDFIILLLP